MMHFRDLGRKYTRVPMWQKNTLNTCLSIFHLYRKRSTAKAFDGDMFESVGMEGIRQEQNGSVIARILTTLVKKKKKKPG